MGTIIPRVKHIYILYIYIYIYKLYKEIWNMLKPTTRSWLHSYPSMISIGSKSLLQPNAGQLAVARSTRRVASRVARVAAATRVAGLGSLWNAHGAGMFAYGCMTGWFWKVGESSWIFRMWSCAVQPSSLLTMLSCADEVPTLSHDMLDSFGLTEKNRTMWAETLRNSV